MAYGPLHLTNFRELSTQFVSSLKLFPPILIPQEDELIPLAQKLTTGDLV